MPDTRSLIKMILFNQFSLLLFATILALIVWHWADLEQDNQVWRTLTNHSPAAPLLFDESLIEKLPESAQRYFRYSIAPGTPLLGVAEINMHGEIAVGSMQEPNYQAMTAQQILAPPFGLIWRLDTAAVSGSDVAMPTYSWTRFRLYNLIPVVRISHSSDHRRAAFGRVIAEAAIWSPASLLPAYNAGHQVEWAAIGSDLARATLRFGDLEQSVDITVNKLGQPTKVEINRWSNANPQNSYRWQPFGGYLSDYRTFEGYTLATTVEGGNMIGTDDYFPFYKAYVDNIHFPRGE